MDDRQRSLPRPSIVHRYTGDLSACYPFKARRQCDWRPRRCRTAARNISILSTLCLIISPEQSTCLHKYKRHQGRCKVPQSTMAAPKVSIVIPNAVRNQVVVVRSCNRRQGRLGPSNNASSTASLTHLIPHCLRNDKAGAGPQIGHSIIEIACREIKQYPRKCQISTPPGV
jgi:hypothetical protein